MVVIAPSKFWIASITGKWGQINPGPTELE